MVALPKPSGPAPKMNPARAIRVARAIVSGQTPKGFEWVDNLSPAHQRQFAVEMYQALAQWNVTGDVNDVMELLDSWQATAEIDMAPQVAAKLRSARERKHHVDWADAPR